MTRRRSSSLFVLISILGLGLALTAAPALAGHVLDIRALGSGSATGTCIPPDGFDANCTVASSGEVFATHLGHGPTQRGNGTFTLELTAGPDVLNNSEGGDCRAANRSDANAQAAVLVAANGDTINLNTVGTLCEENGPGTSLHYNGTYRVVGGSGRFADAVGGGSLTATFERGTDTTGRTFLKLEGTIRYSGPTVAPGQ
jgi:hypothetical protein